MAPFRSAADRDQRDREREESKRLLYVAATRARDRLYLSATLTAGTIEPGVGSLAAVMPPALLEGLAGVSKGGRVSWAGPSGRAHGFAVVGAEAADGSFRPLAEPPPLEPDRFGPWCPAGGPPRVAATVLAATAAAGGRARTHGVDRVVGRLVHRLLREDGERGGRGSSDAEPGGRALAAMEREERARVDCRALAEEAAAVYRRSVGRPDVAALLEGDCLFEVPFTLRRTDGDAGRVFVRGAIDCLRRWPDGRVTVVEVKTGASRPEHESQLALYVEAARALFPGRPVDGRLLYLS